MSTIKIDTLVKRYGRTEAVAEVSLEVASGEVLGLLGASGCGKTTILKCIAGLEQPSGGQISIDGRLVASPRVSVPPERRDIGMVFQSYALWPHKTVYSNVSYPLEVRHVRRAEIRPRVERALELVGLSELGARYPSQLSGGQQQRVAVARSIVYEPKILLFDEPLSNLDANTRARVRNDLKRLLHRLGITSIYVTHDQVEAMAICDRVVLMQAGRVVQVGAPEELYARPASLAVAELIGAGTILAGRTVAEGEVDAAGLRVQCVVPAGLTVGSSVNLVLRREVLKLEAGPGAGDPNCWPGRVSERTAYGAYFEYLVASGDAELLVQTGDGTWNVGDELRVRIAAENVICFPST
jgi:ABC-type Fe3+/spermidine/putrescine transport system ATPase subunit